MGNVHDYDFCSEMCRIYEACVKRLEAYKIPGLIEHSRKRINPYCRESCTHTGEEFREWLKKRQAMSRNQQEFKARKFFV